MVELERLNFVYPSSNAKGEGSRITVRVPPELHRIMTILFESRRWPYITFADLVRHALFNHVEFLGAEGAETNRLVYLRAMVVALNVEDENVHFNRMVDKTRELVAAHMEHGDIDDASRVVNKMLGSIMSMPSGGMRARYERELRDEYGALCSDAVDIDVVALVDLDPSKAVEE